MDGLVDSPQAKPSHLVKGYYFVSWIYFAICYRFLTLYFQADGLSATEIGALWAVFRVIGTVSTPFWASVADRTKRARDIVQGSIVCGVVSFLLLAIPVKSSGQAFILRAATFWTFALFAAPHAALIDALAIAACEKDVGRWGKARLYGAMSWGLTNLLLGYLIDEFGFAILFASFAVSGVFTFITTHVSVPQACGEVKKSATCREVFNIFTHNRLFFVNMIVMGAGFCMMEGTLFLLLQEMHASKFLCGFSVLMSIVFEVPTFHYSKKLMDTLGCGGMILLGQVIFAFRAFFYTQMSVASTALLIEPLHGLTYALVWTAATQYVANPWVSGEGLEASAQGLLLVCFSGVGPFIGLTIGGRMIDAIGSRAVYAIFAGIILLVGLTYARWGGIEARNREATGFSEAPKGFELGVTN